MSYMQCYMTNFCKKDFIINCGFAYLLLLSPFVLLWLFSVIVFPILQNFPILFTIGLYLITIVVFFAPFVIATFKWELMNNNKWNENKICFNDKLISIIYFNQKIDINIDNIKSITKYNTSFVMHIYKLVKRYFYHRKYPEYLYNPYVKFNSIIKIDLKNKICIRRIRSPTTISWGFIIFYNEKIRKTYSEVDQIFIEIDLNNQHKFIKKINNIIKKRAKY